MNFEWCMLIKSIFLVFCKKKSICLRHFVIRERRETQEGCLSSPNKTIIAFWMVRKCVYSVAYAVS